MYFILNINTLKTMLNKLIRSKGLIKHIQLIKVITLIILPCYIYSCSAVSYFKAYTTIDDEDIFFLK